MVWCAVDVFETRRFHDRGYERGVPKASQIQSKASSFIRPNFRGKKREGFAETFVVSKATLMLFAVADL